MSSTVIKERPIIFSSSLTSSLLDGRKSQTRRIVKPQHTRTLRWENQTAEEIALCFRCPFGVPGDRLWVREAWQYWTDVGCTRHVEYRACETISGDGHAEAVRDGGDGGGFWPSVHAIRWRSPLYMPRWASRITLEITEVRVQRVQDISEDDAKAEGCEYREHFIRIWDSIHGPGAWTKNPWVWVVTFRRITQA